MPGVQLGVFGRSRKSSELISPWAKRATRMRFASASGEELRASQPNGLISGHLDVEPDGTAADPASAELSLCAVDLGTGGFAPFSLHVDRQYLRFDVTGSVDPRQFEGRPTVGARRVAVEAVLENAFWGRAFTVEQSAECSSERRRPAQP